MMIRPPNRVRHTWAQTIQAPPEKVFPLLCPVRECEWVPGWAPLEVLSDSGVAEDGCIFVTPAGEGASTWVVTRFEPPRRIEFVKHTPGETMGHIAIRLRAGGGETTRSEVTYAFTSLGPDGDAAVAAFTAEHYRDFMEGWEAALNHFLATGSMIEPAGGDE